ncbi:MAG: 6-phosphofructokinase [Actinomycetota bacterium]|nr:6-phosphofructokinase [Actinomycetota bacterium]
MQNNIRKIGILTSGGDASGMNAAIRAAVRYAIYKKIEVYGYYEGFKGLLSNNYKILSNNSVGGIIDRGGTVLYTARSEIFKTKEGLIKAKENLKKSSIDALIVIGGDGSFRGARDLNDLGVNTVGIPATIDNDIYGTDLSLGFDTALNVIISLVSKIRDTASSHERIFVIEVMGRNSGELAIRSGLACGADYVLIPEIKVDLVKISNAIKNHREGKRHTLVVVAEGAAKAEEVASSIKLLVDHEVRFSVLGHIQRGGSPSAVDRVLAAQFAKKAIDFIVSGGTNAMTAISNNKISIVDFKEIFSNTKTIDKELYDYSHILAK